ncbi:hypothetical protein LZK98_08275 [Sphingomonas cannabina]|uniref:helix-turn-helix domain-containing protein n=1 Tax=Sphingomonas cannabina TaxID=2899123 RepID=UPI001F3F325E|nr:helix-turn-helix domain-containing protein [Sphingomonas cannabina]UIJ46925.1 hypothetical protein LZK98_08275 [Sphingomonas cannabina]
MPGATNAIVFDADIEARLSRLEKAMARLLGTPLAPVESLPPGVWRGLVADASNLFGVSAAEIMADGRRFAALRARYAISWVSQEATKLSLTEVGRRLGERDHTTIIHALERAKELRGTDANFRRATDELLEGLLERLSS